MHKKRGQVTAFIILGMLVVASILGVYFARDYVLKSAWERSYEKSLVVPKQAENVKNYIDSCVNDLANRGIDLLGQQGGYIVIPDDPLKDPLDKFSNAIEIFPGFKTVYWYYKAKNNLEVFQKPSLGDMEEELAAYIDENLRDCLGSFGNIEGYRIQAGNVKSGVEIKDEEVLVSTDFLVHIELKDFKFDIKKFYTRIESPLGKLYKEAVEIYEKENLDLFLEKNAMNTLVLSDEIPVTGVTIDCGTKIWARKDVENAVKEYVPLNLQMLRVKGTNYELANPERGDYYEVDFGIRDFGIDASFYTSKEWPFELEIIPAEGELLKAESVTKSAGVLEGLAQSFFCMNYYQFLYNLKFPVLVSLSKDGYTFKFAMQAVVERNEARKATFEPISVPDVDKTFCENKQNELDIYVYDNEGSSVDDVDIKFTCVNMRCDIGKTKGNHLKAAFPICINGIVVASKEDYGAGRTVVSTNEASIVSMSMDKIREIGTEVRVSGRVSSTLSESEKAFVNLVDSEKEYSTSLIYPEQKSIKLIPGDYEAYIYVLKETSGITVSGERKEVCVNVPETGVAGWFGAKKEKCVTIDVPSTTLVDVMIGGAKFKISINLEDLRKGKVIFYAPYKGVPKNLEDLSMLNLEAGEDFVYPRFE